MRILFLSAKDAASARFEKGKKRMLLKTEYGTADRVAFCGRLDSWERKGDELSMTLKDLESVVFTAGEGSGKAGNDATSIIEKKLVTFVLAYCTPTEDERLLLQEIVETTSESCKRFHMLAEKAREHLLEKPHLDGEEDEPTEVSDEEIVAYVTEKDVGSGVPVDEVVAHFVGAGSVYERVLELMDAGQLYEPTAGKIKVLA
jgi:hypothetical protein